jgi:hypothetical protein
MGGIRKHLRSNIVGYIALFFALSTGSAVALNGSNTVQSDDLGPGAQVKAPDVAANAVNGSDVVDNSLNSADVTGLTGADINEATLGQVPSALLGGFGRSNGGGSCNPESTTYNACAVVTVNLPAPARLLLVGQAAGSLEGSSYGSGFCHIGTTSGPVANTQELVIVQSESHWQNVSVSGITPPFPPGQHSFGIDCNEYVGTIQFSFAGISAVAISPD